MLPTLPLRSIHVVQKGHISIPTAVFYHNMKLVFLETYALSAMIQLLFLNTYRRIL